MPPLFIEKDARQPLLPSSTHPEEAVRPRWLTKRNAVIALTIPLGIISILCFPNAFRSFSRLEQIPSGWLERCAWRELEPHVSLLNVPAITREEFLQRQSILAAALDDAGVDAFIAEPSASS